ncbi:hypothetical protein FisN_16Hh114 [Fistulifera solaris]|uniref:HD domain-containing protein n=1 Tax=Fistulifera solaris TaxID=1519565 RepID=A0A1Z5KTL6_FISSO|nr:hypothetical protein FisN_16Hh114 [Fistulifera solaris]|eukprot:GAX29445.1 hypothetical protein FisN_16Hh114 [Fistulifera solaris]
MLDDISSIVSNGDFNSRKEGVRDYLWKEWQALFPADDSPCCTEWFDRLWKLQAEDPARHYHTAVHLQEMLLYFHFLRPQFLAEQQRAVILAIFFHDAIYDATSNTNEEDSVTLFQSFETNALVDDMILATKSHHSVDPNMKDTSVIAFFLDLDLSVLGKTEEAYQRYAILIQKEYSHVPHETYCQKRADILETFLQQQNIYKTALFREMFEERARSNLAAEIRCLRQGIISQPN